MTRAEFESAARKQNAERDAEVLNARKRGTPCDTVPMLAFGGILYCRAHGVMGVCPFASQERAS